MAIPVSVLAKLRALLVREAPQQVVPIREALRRTAATNLEHGVVGVTDRGGESVITRGNAISVKADPSDLRHAKNSGSNVIDFHTHPNPSVGFFGVAPSKMDFSYYGKQYPFTGDRELRTLIATPPVREPGVRQGASFNFFATDNPSKVFDPMMSDLTKWELQRAARRGKFDSVKDSPMLRSYLDSGGSMEELLGEVAPLLYLRRRAEQGLGRHEFEFGGRRLAPDPESNDVSVFKLLEPNSMDVIRAQKFASGGLAQYKECNCGR